MSECWQALAALLRDYPRAPREQFLTPREGVSGSQNRFGAAQTLISVQMAAHDPARRQPGFFRIGLPAHLHGLAAAGMKMTAGRRVGG